MVFSDIFEFRTSTLLALTEPYLAWLAGGRALKFLSVLQYIVQDHLPRHSENVLTRLSVRHNQLFTPISLFHFCCHRRCRFGNATSVNDRHCSIFLFWWAHSISSTLSESATWLKRLANCFLFSTLFTCFSSSIARSSGTYWVHYCPDEGRSQPNSVFEPIVDESLQFLKNVRRCCLRVRIAIRIQHT